MAGLVFHPGGHRYELDGRPLPSVSEIIRPLGADVPEPLESVFDAAAERGGVLHRVLELRLSGEPAENEYPEEYKGYVDSINRFLAEHQVESIAAERPVYHPELHYAGTPDLVCLFDGAISILDYKFVAQIAKTKVKAQLNAYEGIYRALGAGIEALYAVQFLPNGSYRLYPVAVDDTEFRLCLELWRLARKRHPKGRIE